MGGTFDPIHNAHIAVAEEVRTRLDLNEVLFVPAGRPWLKEDSHVSPAEHRVKMVLLTIEGNPYFKLCTVEIDRDGHSYTVDTLAALQAQYSPEDKLFFMLGWDSLAQLPRWKEPSLMIKMCRLVAVPRPGYQLPDLESLEADIPGLSQSLIVLDSPEIDISATDIRDRVARGLSIQHLVPSPVARYITQNKLYLEQ